MFSKIKVNGADAHPAYKFLKANAPQETGEEIGWNFAKFLVGRDGQVLARYSPRATPEQIGAALAEWL